MKKYLSGLLTGIALTTLVGSLVIGASAISSRMTIEVDPINVMVNGQTFVPTDVTGKEVPVFAYEGTTYAPLRALAEAYGLEVGYDAEKNMATVSDPDNLPNTTTKVDVPDTGDKKDDDTQAPSYEEFKAMWEVDDRDDNIMAYYVGGMDKGEFIAVWEQNTEKYEEFCTRFVVDICKEKGYEAKQMRFWFGNVNCAFSVQYRPGKTNYVDHIDELRSE